MENDKIQIAGSRRTEDKLSEDVARLYSWANVEDAQYHDFSRHRRIRGAPTRPAENLQESAVPVDSSDFQDTSRNEIQTPEVPVAKSTPVISDYLGFAEAFADRSESPFSRRENSEDERVTPRLRDVAAETADNPSKINGRATAESYDSHPVVTIYSLAGGVGKTTLSANLGRALSSTGEKVSLIDATGSGILPFYFGATDLRPGGHTFPALDVLRNPLRLIDPDTISAEWLSNEVMPEIQSSDWTIFDLGQASANLLPQIMSISSMLIVPLLPELNSIVTISRLESSLQAMRLRGADVPNPFYLFNQFDPHDPIDQEARSLVLRQCGGRLLPISIGWDSDAARAIAARKTTIDYAPGSEIAMACARLAALLRAAALGNRERRSQRSCAVA